jgi:translation initiation factor IF-2
MSLLEKEIYLEGMGGDIAYIPVSAKTGKGVDDLLEAIKLAVEFEELSGDINEKASGYVLESSKDKKRGISSTLLIKNGSIKSGDFVVASKSLAPVRIMEDFNGKIIKEATFSTPINIIGFDSLPKAGDAFSVFTNKKEAQNYIKEMLEIEQELENSKKTKFSRRNKKSKKHLFPIIIKADVTGSLEAIKHLLKDISLKKSEYKIITEGVGEISDTDLKTAAGDNNTTIIGFNVGISRTAKSIAETFNMEVKISDIVYRLTEYLEERLKTLTPKNMEEEVSGEAKILKIFSESNKGSVVGAEVFNGVIEKTDRLRIVRRDNLIGEARILELQQSKKNVQEVTQGLQFGLMLSSKLDVAPGDMIRAIRMVEK